MQIKKMVVWVICAIRNIGFVFNITEISCFISMLDTYVYM